MTEGSWRPLQSGISADLVRGVLTAHRSRSTISENLFSDPAWDILLELYATELAQTTTSKAAICVALGLSETLTERWLDALDQRDLVTRNQTRFGEQIALSATGSAAMQRYFAAIATSTPPL